METTLALIFLVGLAMSSICSKLRLPGIIGMLVTGVILGPFVLDLISPTILNISSELRQIALIIILIKAGLSLNISDLKKVGRPAVLMPFLPALCELSAYLIFAPTLLGVSIIEAAVMGSVVAAVSPAVVVPRMVNLIENKYGTDKGIPQLLLAGASLDDVFVIVLFTTFIRIAQGGKTNILDFVNIPLSVLLGVLIGAISGWLLSMFFEASFSHKHLIRNSTKVIIVIAVSFMLMSVEHWLEGIVAVSGLLAVMSMACVISMKCIPAVTKRLSEKFGKLWIAAELILFVLVGAAVDIRYTMKAGILAVAMILIALLFRTVGVLLCLVRTPLNKKERLFCVISYLPKATVQAAIGGIPLAIGLPCGNIVLSVAVLSIIITAPLCAFGMDFSYKKLLQKSNETDNINDNN